MDGMDGGAGRRERADSLSCETRNMITEVGEGGLGEEYGRLGEPDRVHPSTLPSLGHKGLSFSPSWCSLSASSSASLLPWMWMLTSLKVSWLTSQTQKSPPTYCRYQGSHPGRKVVNLVSQSLLDSSRALPGPWRHIASETGVEEACKPEQRPVVGAWAGDSSLHQSLVWILLILSSWSGPWRRCY